MVILLSRIVRFSEILLERLVGKPVRYIVDLRQR